MSLTCDSGFSFLKALMAKFAGEHIRCCVTGAPGGDEHHILSQKSFPEFAEKTWNRIPLTHFLHAQAHNKGMVWMSEEYFAVKKFLIDNGWELQVDPKVKWVHPMAMHGGH